MSAYQGSSRFVSWEISSIKVHSKEGSCLASKITDCTLTPGSYSKVEAKMANASVKLFCSRGKYLKLISSK